LLAAARECAFLGLVSTSPTRRSIFAEQFAPAETYDSLEDLAAAGAEAVTISTPADTHVELVQRALRLALAVVCDKPFALAAASARETGPPPGPARRPLTIYQNRRGDADCRTGHKLLAAGRLGEP